MFERIGTAGRVAGYDILILTDRVLVSHDAGGTRDHAVPNHGTGIGELAARPGFRLGWGRFPDGAEVLYVYDTDDGGFGYAVNLTAPDCSEWGYAPFEGVPANPPRADEVGNGAGDR